MKREGCLRRPARCRPRPTALLAVSLLGSFLPVPARGQTDAAAPPLDLVAAYDTLVPRVLAEHDAPGAVLALVEDGRIVATRGYGMADVERGVEMTGSTPFHVASLSKPVAAWGVLRLVREDELELDAPIDDVLRRWHVPASVHGTEGVTARRLLSHTAGVGMPSVAIVPVELPAPALEDVLERRSVWGGPVRIERPPGSVWSYSGGGYTILELAVEEVSGERFDVFMRRAAFDRLGMAATTFTPFTFGDARGYDEAGSPVPAHQFVGTAAAGLVTTAEDFARLLVAYHEAWTGGAEPVLAREQLLALSEPIAPVMFPGVEGAFYGLGHGTHRTADDRVLLYHSGNVPGYRAYFIVDPEAGDGFFVAVNSDRGIPVIVQLREVWGVALGGDLPPVY